MNQNFAKIGTARHFGPYDAMQQKAHSFTYEMLLPSKLNLNLTKSVNLTKVQEHGVFQEPSKMTHLGSEQLNSKCNTF